MKLKCDARGRVLPGPTRDLKERFWEKVDKRGPDECWSWKAFRNRRGYGTFYHPEKGTNMLAARVSFFLAHGRWPNPCACHTCDNPPCVNPKHLFEGDQDANMKDAMLKGRKFKKLTNEIVAKIREERTNNQASPTELAKRYNVSRRTIFYVSATTVQPAP